MPLSVGLMSLTTPASAAWESISPLVKFYLHLPKVCTHRDECKSCKKIGCSFRNCCWWKLILAPTSYLPPLLSVSLFIPSYVPSLSLFLLRSFALGQRKALTPRLLPSLHCQLFFIFHGEGVGVGVGVGIENKRARVKRREHVETTVSSLPLSLFSYIHLLPPPLSSRWPSFSFQFSPFLPAFLLIFACPSL